MKIEKYIYPKSSFLSVEKDLSIIVDRIMKNKRLQRLLYYTTPDALDRPNLNQEQLIELLDNNIEIVPRVYVEFEMKTKIFIFFKDFSPNYSNPEFRDNLIEIDILCPYELWRLKDFQLRPYRIAAELDTMLNDSRLTGIGKTIFVGANLETREDQAVLCLRYATIHGEEDKKKMPNPVDEEQFLKDFEDYVEAE